MHTEKVGCKLFLKLCNGHLVAIQLTIADVPAVAATPAPAPVSVPEPVSVPASVSVSVTRMRERSRMLTAAAGRIGVFVDIAAIAVNSSRCSSEPFDVYNIDTYYVIKVGMHGIYICCDMQYYTQWVRSV